MNSASRKNVNAIESNQSSLEDVGNTSPRLNFLSYSNYHTDILHRDYSDSIAPSYYCHSFWNYVLMATMSFSGCMLHI